MANLTEKALHTQEEYGLPPEPLHDFRMMFVPQPPVLLLQLSVERLGIRIPQLFLRAAGSQRYVNILDSATRSNGDEIVRGARTPISHPSGILYFLLVEHQQAGVHRFGRMRSVVRFDLSSNRGEVWDPSTCQVGACTPIELLSTDDDGVYAKAGFNHPSDAESSHGYSVEYQIVQLRWADRVVKKLFPLPAIFY
jgi:hypothetical protein